MDLQLLRGRCFAFLFVALIASALTNSPALASTNSATEGQEALESNSKSPSHSIVKRASRNSLEAERLFDAGKRDRTRENLLDLFNSIRTRSPIGYNHGFVGKRSSEGNHKTMQFFSPTELAMSHLFGHRFVRYVRRIPAFSRALVGKRRFKPLSYHSKRLTSKFMTRNFPGYDHKFVGKRDPMMNDENDARLDDDFEEHSEDFSSTDPDVTAPRQMLEVRDVESSNDHDDDYLSSDALSSYRRFIPRDLGPLLVSKRSARHSISKRSASQIDKVTDSLDLNDSVERPDLPLLSRSISDLGTVELEDSISKPDKREFEEGIEIHSAKRIPDFHSFVGKRVPDFHSFVGKRVPDFHSFVGKRVPDFHSFVGKRGPDFHSFIGKRIPDFHSFVGKRAPSDDFDFHSHVDKRAPDFHSFVGKRAPDFHSFVGKRVPDFHSFVGKRVPDFHSFVGKRAPDFHSFVGKRMPDFHSFVGKRAPSDDFEYHSHVGKRAPDFHSFVGKRIPDFHSFVGKRVPDFHSFVGKRVPDFHSFVGKRVPPDDLEYYSPAGKRVPDFHSFVGKRGLNFHSFVGKRVPDFHSFVGKRIPDFHSFVGKRYPDFHSFVGKRVHPDFHSFVGKRMPNFHSFVGKREPDFHAFVRKRTPDFHSFEDKRRVDFHSFVGKRYPELSRSFLEKRASGFDKEDSFQNVLDTQTNGLQDQMMKRFGDKNPSENQLTSNANSVGNDPKR